MIHKNAPGAINAIAFNLARSLGPALGGLVISLWSVNLAFALNAVSYLAMIVVLSYTLSFIRWATPARAQLLLRQRYPLPGS